MERRQLVWGRDHVMVSTDAARFLLVAALVAGLAGCSSKAGSAEAVDAGEDASWVDAGACALSVEDFCSREPCLRDWPSAQDPSRWCSTLTPPAEVAMSTACPGGLDSVRFEEGTDTRARYFYDARTGALVGVVTSHGVTWQCAAGPGSFAFPESCTYGDSTSCK